jgi:glutaredoxin-dependent peroxiredoxin
MEIGSKAPDFTLLDTERKERALREFTGKKVLAFFPGAFTGVCESEMCSWRDSLAELNGMSATIIGISVDSPFANAAFAKQNNLGYPLLSDYERKTIKDYDVELADFAGMVGYTSSQRSVFILDENNIVRFHWTGENAGVLPDYDAIKEELKKF